MLDRGRGATVRRRGDAGPWATHGRWWRGESDAGPWPARPVAARRDPTLDDGRRPAGGDERRPALDHGRARPVAARRSPTPDRWRGAVVRASRVMDEPGKDGLGACAEVSGG